MTCIAAYVTDTEVAIGSDTGFTMGLLKANVGEAKLIELNDSLGDPRPTYIGIAGDAVARQYICGQSAEPPPLRSADDLPAWVEGWIEFYTARGLRDPEEGAAPTMMLVVTPEEPGGPYALFVIDGHGSITHVDPAVLPYFAIGSGGLVAFGALAVAPLTDPANAVWRAVSAAIKHADGCNGTPKVVRLDRKRGDAPFDPALDEAADKARALIDAADED